MNSDLKNAGDIAANLGLTKRSLREFDTLASILERRPTFAEFAYQHAVLCQVGLPRRRVEGTRFMRRSGDAWLNVQAGMLDEGKGPVRQPVPYGPLPRLALAHVSTFAVQNRTPEVPIGDSASEFLRRIGVEPDGGKRFSSLRRQMHALAACYIQLGYRGVTVSGSPIRKFSAWTNDRGEEQSSIWPGRLLLSQEFYKTLIETAVPLDMRALNALSGSSLALDIYTTLAHRLWRIEGSVTIHWSSLRAQFGQEYQGKDGARTFKRKFKKALADVLKVYPQAKVIVTSGGIQCFSSPPPVPPRGGKSFPLLDVDC